MGEQFNQLPAEVQDHLRDIIMTSGLDNTEESLDLLAGAWMEKKAAFEREIESAGMEEVEFLGREDLRGALAMTYSGSLVNIGPLAGEGRKAQYTSIGLRADVPDSAETDAAQLTADLAVDEEISFKKGPVKRTSSVFKIAVYNDSLKAEDQEKVISRATMILTDNFTDINRTYMGESR